MQTTPSPWPLWCPRGPSTGRASTGARYEERSSPSWPWFCRVRLFTTTRSSVLFFWLQIVAMFLRGRCRKHKKHTMSSGAARTHSRETTTMVIYLSYSVDNEDLQIFRANQWASYLLFLFLVFVSLLFACLHFYFYIVKWVYTWLKMIFWLKKMLFASSSSNKVVRWRKLDSEIDFVVSQWAPFVFLEGIWENPKIFFSIFGRYDLKCEWCLVCL